MEVMTIIRILAIIALGVSLFAMRGKLMSFLLSFSLKGRGFILWGITLSLASSIVGVSLFLAGSVGLGWFLSRFLIRPPAFLPTLIGIALAFGPVASIIRYWWKKGTEAIPVGSVGQMLFLGERLQIGEKGVVVKEGFRALPLPRLFSLVLLDVRETSLQLFAKGEDGKLKSRVVVLTSDGVQTTWYPTLEYIIEEASKYLSIKSSVIEEGLVGSTVESFRGFTLRFEANSLIKGLSSMTWDPDVHPTMTIETFGTMKPEEKQKLTLIPVNKLLIRDTMRGMKGDADRWGIKILNVIPGNVRFPEEVERAFSQEIVETRQAIAEKIEGDNLYDRAWKLMGLDPNLSASEALLVLGDERGKSSSRRRIAIDGAEGDPLTRGAATLGSLLAERIRGNSDRSSPPPESPASNGKKKVN